MVNLLGWIGSILLAFCAAPEAYRALKTEKYSISSPFVVMWGLGEAFTLIPLVIEKNQPYLILNYSVNLVFILVIVGRLFVEKRKGNG